MPRITLPSLENEVAQRVVTAVAAGATVYIKPSRFPKWVRRGVSLSNTLTSVGMAIAGDRKPERTRLEDGKRQDIVEVANGMTVSRAGANWAAAASAGMALVSSGIALRIDSRIEKSLLKRGVTRPRLIMAVGAAGLSLASPWITERIQKSTAKLQAKALSGTSLESALADPLGRNSRQAGTSASAQPSQLGPGVTETSVRNSEQEERSEADKTTEN